MVDTSPESTKYNSQSDCCPYDTGISKTMALAKLHSYASRFNATSEPRLDPEGGYFLTDQIVGVAVAEAVEKLKSIDEAASIKMLDFEEVEDAVFEVNVSGQVFLAERDTYIVYDGSLMSSTKNYIINMPTEKFDQDVALEALAYAEDIINLFENSYDNPTILDSLFECFGVSDKVSLRELFDQIGLRILKIDTNSADKDSGIGVTEIDSLVGVIYKTCSASNV